MTKRGIEHPLIFNTEMVRALQYRSKTQTRRGTNYNQLKRANILTADWMYLDEWNRWRYLTNAQIIKKCPHGRVGEFIWVRESWFSAPPGTYDRPHKVCPFPHINEAAYYKASWGLKNMPQWLSPLFMPRWASRLLLEIVDVRIEALQDISESDAVAEGVEPYKRPFVHDGDYEAQEYHVHAFLELWQSIYPRSSQLAVEKNPFVYVIAFKKVK